MTVESRGNGGPVPSQGAGKGQAVSAIGGVLRLQRRDRLSGGRQSPLVSDIPEVRHDIQIPVTVKLELGSYYYGDAEARRAPPAARPAAPPLPERARLLQLPRTASSRASSQSVQSPLHVLRPPSSGDHRACKALRP